MIISNHLAFSHSPVTRFHSFLCFIHNDVHQIKFNFILKLKYTIITFSQFEMKWHVCKLAGMYVGMCKCNLFYMTNRFLFFFFFVSKSHKIKKQSLCIWRYVKHKQIELVFFIDDISWIFFYCISMYQILFFSLNYFCSEWMALNDREKKNNSKPLSNRFIQIDDFLFRFHFHSFVIVSLIFLLFCFILIVISIDIAA